MNNFIQFLEFWHLFFPETPAPGVKYTLSFLLTLIITLVAIFLPSQEKRGEIQCRFSILSRAHIFKGIVVLCLVLGGLVRLNAFGSIPGGVFVDEAIIGYDSYSLLHFGIDHNGISWPVHLPSFGGGQHALYAYLSMPFIAVLGLTPVSIRLVNLVFGLASLFVFYLLVRQTDGDKTALAALLLLVVNPWHIMISRWGLECNLFPAVFLLATYFLVLGLQGRKTFIGSMLLYGLSLYAYGTAYFVVPIFLLGVGILLWIHRRLELRKKVGGLVILVLSGLPIALYVAANQLGWDTIRFGSLTIPRLQTAARFTQIFSLFSGTDIYESIANNASIFFRLMVVQEDGNLWNALPKFGFLYLYALPLVLCGLWAMVQERKNGRRFRLNSVFLIWVGAAVLLAMMMPANINRINILFIPLVYLAARALVFICERSEILAGALVVLVLAWFGLFTNAYFRVYPEHMGAAFNESFGEAIQDASAQTTGTIYISREVHLPYAYVLFYEQPSPPEFLDSVAYLDSQAEFRDAISFGRYRFVDAADMPSGDGAYVVSNRELGLFQLDYYSVFRHKLFSVLIPHSK